MAVVTVSRQYGAGGQRVAAALAEALGFRVADRDVVEAAATQLGMAPEIVEGRDERTPALIEELGMVLAAASPEFAHAPPATRLDDRTLAEATGRVITSLAGVGGYVILGRGGQAELKDRPDACHLHLVGDLADRARRIAKWQGIEERDALERCRKADAERAAYVKRFYGADLTDPLLYQAVLNTTRLGLGGAATAALAVARSALGLKVTS
jgi:cytidylate kinase